MIAASKVLSQLTLPTIPTARVLERFGCCTSIWKDKRDDNPVGTFTKSTYYLQYLAAQMQVSRKDKITTVKLGHSIWVSSGSTRGHECMQQPSVLKAVGL